MPPEKTQIPMKTERKKKCQGKKITSQFKGNCTAQLHLYAVLDTYFNPRSRGVVLCFLSLGLTSSPLLCL
jgi:hypothetical protein